MPIKIARLAMIGILEMPSIANFPLPPACGPRRRTELIRLFMMLLFMAPFIRANSLFRPLNSLFRQKHFPVPRAQGIWRQAIESSRRCAAKIAGADRNVEKSLLFSLFSGNSRHTRRREHRLRLDRNHVD